MTQESYVMRDPTAESGGLLRERTLPSGSLEGKTVALLSISKERSAEFLDTVARRFEERGVHVMRIEKATHTKPAPDFILQDIVEHADLVVEGLAD